MKGEQLAWEKARDRYLVKERFFKGKLVAVEAIVVKSVSAMYTAEQLAHYCDDKDDDLGPRPTIPPGFSYEVKNHS